MSYALIEDLKEKAICVSRPGRPPVRLLQRSQVQSSAVEHAKLCVLSVHLKAASAASGRIRGSHRLCIFLPVQACLSVVPQGAQSDAAESVAFNMAP